MSGFRLYSDRLTLPSGNARASSSRHLTSSRSPPANDVQASASRRVSQEVAILVDSDEDDLPVAQTKPSHYFNASHKTASHQTESSNGHGSKPLHHKIGSMDLDAKEALKVALAKLDKEIKDVEAQLRPLQELHTSLNAERRSLETQLSKSVNISRPANDNTTVGTSIQQGTTNYHTTSFVFSPQILQKLKSTFGLNSFRLCQEGVINAAMDGRDIVCVMPTGGGKSLTYQLPAVMGSGLTVVISPLLALIWDQVRALKEIGVECVMMTGATSTSEQNTIYERMKNGASRGEKEIRLCYVTPEKVSKSKRLISTLEKVNENGRLRDYIDEAHCCSQLGHDFRPDYKKLSMLKTLFPRVPIQAVTATLSSKTLPDLLKILRLGPITDGNSAKSSGTVFFSAPLFRPNLHYKVLPKPSNAKMAISAMGQWIQDNHPGQSGIIYCLSKKDAETVADELRDWSNGDIKTGVYHAGIEDYEKERIHVKWREGRINVICATIAFGLGIDKGDVRYMSKSLEGYYQETGRAGRDGANSDCVLFYRGQDAARLSSLTYADVEGSGKLQEMLKFAQDLKTCRKVAFAKYFSASAHLSASAWDAPDTLSSSSGTTSTCGICDNCTRNPGSIISKDVTIEAWKILKVTRAVQTEQGRVTLTNLSDLARGLGGGMFNVIGGEGRKGKRKANGEKEKFDINSIGGKIALGKDDTETLIIHLLLLGYLQDCEPIFLAWADNVNVYIIPSDTAFRLTRLRLEDIEDRPPVKIECIFPAPKVKKTKTKRGKEGDGADEDDKEVSEADVEDDEGEGDGEHEEKRNSTKQGKKGTSDPPPKSKPKAKGKGKSRKKDEDEEEPVQREWFDIDFSDKKIKKDPIKPKNSARATPKGRTAKHSNPKQEEEEVIVIEDDLDDLQPDLRGSVTPRDQSIEVEDEEEMWAQIMNGDIE
uniref:ATP-dependent DNA helicase n=1 Tax=Kwoniella pini CBS 10737 TaxID=1296096 RepID=A0A1B9HVW6_9TREE|nr:ATP-dependent DNA helicase [Kwoniella pini CBS 10737]OCF47417.1 ATP-dependent DNA helicase [Kwoniella pini CBS 10737]